MDISEGTLELHSPALICREPWWEKPPLPGQDEMTCVWGWLEIYSDMSTRFDPTRPSDQEITNRKGCRNPLLTQSGQELL